MDIYQRLISEPFSRRAVLRASAGVGAAFAVAEISPGRAAPRYALTADLQQANDTLVVVQLPGGFDGLTAVVPAWESAYYQARPTIAVPHSQLLGLDRQFALHP